MSHDRQSPPEERTGLLDNHVESFADSLRDAMYSEQSVAFRKRIAFSFAQWTRNRKLAVNEIDKSHLEAFLRRRSSKTQFATKRGTLHRLLRHLIAEGVVPPSRADSSPAAVVERRYTEYLRNERGLAENSVKVYLQFVRHLLADHTVVGDRLDAETVCDFALGRARGRSAEYARLLTVSLRSFLRFLFLRSETSVDLSLSIPTVRKWSQAGVPAYLSPEEVKRVLSTMNRSTPSGRRNYAILLFLARLGLRAGEIVGLELDDIRWRSGEIIIRGKGRSIDRLPLPSDVGEALAAYVFHDRGASDSRSVFLRLIPPCVGLSGPAAIAHVVRLALGQAGVQRSSRGASHLFRHSLATTMIRQGASLAEISDVLRHRSQDSTRIYAKIDFDALRGVARPWPGEGGA